jgi:hypothetical protein
MSLPNIQNAVVNRDGVSDAQTGPARTTQATETASVTAKVPPLNRTKKSSKARAKKFILHHLDLYGLKVAERHPRTGDIMSVSCRFCVVFGREHSSKAKSGQRPPPSTIKRFKHPWRTDTFSQHLRLQHESKWHEYQQIRKEDQEKFFETDVPYVNQIIAHVETSEQMFFWVSSSIVEDIIAGLLLDVDDIDHSTDKTLSIFKRVDGEDAPADGAYQIVIKKKNAFSLIIRYVSAGLSFRQAQTVLQQTCNTTGLRNLAGVSEQNVREYVRAAVGINLQKISDILRGKRCWAFSIAFDGATRRGKSFVDVRLRILVNGSIENLHLLATPIRVSHTGQAMADLVGRLLDAICLERAVWKSKLVGISTDGAASMAGRLSGAVTRLACGTLSGFYRVWCGAHQLDLVIQNVMSTLCSDTFYTHLTSLIGHLRRQQNLVAEMGCTCPTVAHTRWMSLGRVANWLYENRSRVQEHLEEKKPACAPPQVWWIALLAVRCFMEPVDKCFRKLQGLSTLVVEQDALLGELVHALHGILTMEGPLEPTNIAARKSEGAIVGIQFSASLSAVVDFINDLGIYAQDFLLKISDNEAADLKFAIGEMFIKGVEGIRNIQAERSFTNSPSDDRLPPVLPLGLAALQPREFSRIILEQRPRLILSWEAQRVQRIEDEFRMFKSALHNESSLKIVLQNTTSTDGFRESWAPLGARFPMLRDFCGGLATVFPGTSSVESDFSVLNWEFDEFRQSLTEFSLEGIMQSKQFWKLQELRV